MVLAWLARASIYAHPARYEPFGLSVLEAAQLRCALVLGDIPSLREVWGSAAIYVDPDDAAAIEQQVNRLARHDRLRHRMANAARHRAERYSTRACASAYVRAYRSLAGAVHAADVPRAVEVS
jgi:glycosyltransferase involved in cell wall biosynthesis